MENVYEDRLVGCVWQSSPVSESPVVVLVGWCVYEVKLPGRVERTRHFSGTKANDGRGKASSSIVQFDSAARRGVTESGRVYLLESSVGTEANVRYVWNEIVRINCAMDVIDVTNEIVEMMERKA
jgi:hypothetical protein